MSEAILPRRDLLKLAALGALVAAGPSGACSSSRASPRGARRVVHVELRGGNDGLNCVVPYSDARYRAARPKLAFTEAQLCRLERGLGFHPNLAPLLPLWNRGRMAVIQCVGSPRPDRSHFFTRRVWETGDPTGSTRDGWLARLIEQRSQEAPVCVGDEPLRLCASERVTPCVVRDLTDLELARQVTDVFGIETWLEVLEGAGLDEARAAYVVALRRSQRMPKIPADTAGRPPSLRERLDTIATMIELGIDTGAYATMLDGFDLHTMQAYRHAVLLQEFAEAVASFFARLERSGHDRGVLLVASSEFGRRVAENGASGTDHGLAGPAFAFGPEVAGGLYGPAPDLSDLDEGDLRARIDLRRLAADVAEHLDLDLARVLGQRFEPVGFRA